VRSWFGFEALHRADDVARHMRANGYEVWVSTAYATSFIEVAHTDAEADVVREMVLAHDISATPTTAP